MIKRIFDITVSLVALLLLSPLLLIVAIFIMSDGGSPLYRQQRVGLGGKTFPMFKFRSMVLNADKIGGYSTASDDPRITKIGKFIRKTSIDELPQFLNVIFGDMSLIGPRPNVPAQKNLYSDADWDLRHSVRPGISGLAQAINRSSGTEADRLALDLQYVREQSFGFDMKIIWMTLQQLLLKRGSN